MNRGKRKRLGTDSELRGGERVRGIRSGGVTHGEAIASAAAGERAGAFEVVERERAIVGGRRDVHHFGNIRGGKVQRGTTRHRDLCGRGAGLGDGHVGGRGEINDVGTSLRLDTHGAEASIKAGHERERINGRAPLRGQRFDVAIRDLFAIDRHLASFEHVIFVANNRERIGAAAAIDRRFMRPLLQRDRVVAAAASEQRVFDAGQ